MGRLKTIGPRLATLKATPVRVLQTKAGASERVRGSAWMAKKAEIQELHRFTCAACGTVRADHEVDHIVPLEQGGAPMANSNLQLLCSGPDRCHAKKTAREAELRAGRPADRGSTGLLAGGRGQPKAGRGRAGQKSPAPKARKPRRIPRAPKTPCLNSIRGKSKNSKD